MSVKSIFIILISIVASLVAINNTDAVNFWFFGNSKISKLAIIGGVFFAGWLGGFLMGKSGNKPKETSEFKEYEEDESGLSHEDREYIN
ncbi:MAG: hypothetical protein K9H63_03355 [Sphingobacteriaceae bacterium]|nr:hypothetical protein [Sphingobacteriaceae bacterium]